MKILLSNPSIQYSKQTFKALKEAGHEVVFATAYWYRPKRVLEQIISLTPLKSYLTRYSDDSINGSQVITRLWATCFHFLIKFLPFDVEQKSYWEDRLQDSWVSNFIKKWKPQLVIGYEKSSIKSFRAADSIGAIKWLDLSQVHPNFIESLRNSYNFFNLITGSPILFKKITQLKVEEYQLADTIFCLSDFAAKTLTDAAIPKEKIVVNPLGFNELVFEEKESLPSKKQQPLRFIYTGIITKRKGVDLLLEVFSELPSDKAALTLIGPPGDASSILNSYLERKNIFYTPYIQQKELANALSEADVFVFPSFLDSWAAVVLEAMASGLPVIVTKNTGAVQLVTVKNGIVIPVGDKHALFNAMTNFLQFPQLNQVMGRSAAEMAKQFTWKRYNAQIAKELNKIIPLISNV